MNSEGVSRTFLCPGVVYAGERSQRRDQRGAGGQKMDEEGRAGERLVRHGCHRGPGSSLT